MKTYRNYESKYEQEKYLIYYRKLKNQMKKNIERENYYLFIFFSVLKVLKVLKVLNLDKN